MTVGSKNKGVNLFLDTDTPSLNSALQLSVKVVFDLSVLRHVENMSLIAYRTPRWTLPHDCRAVHDCIKFAFLSISKQAGNYSCLPAAATETSTSDSFCFCCSLAAEVGCGFQNTCEHRQHGQCRNTYHVFKLLLNYYRR